jgi:hypothetical protein
MEEAMNDHPERPDGAGADGTSSPKEVQRPRLTIRVGGQEVIGEVLHQSRRDIAVRILTPYHGFVTGLHVPYFGASYVSFEGERGEQEGRYLLRQLYELGCFLERNQSRLADAWAEFCTARSPVGPNPCQDGLLAERRDLRSALRRGELTPTQYQTALGEERRKHQEHEMIRFRTLRDFFVGNFPMTLGVDLENQVIAVLEGRASFKS